MTKSQKRVITKIKKEIKNFFPIPEEGDRVYSFIKQVEQIINKEEFEYRERKRAKEEMKWVQFLIDGYDNKTGLQPEIDVNAEESGDI